MNKDGIHLQLCLTAALYMLAFGIEVDDIDNDLQAFNDSVLLLIKKFCQKIVSAFGG